MKQVEMLNNEVNLMKIKEATFEERFQRLLDERRENEERWKDTSKRIDQLTSWSIGWRTTVIILLSTLILQLLLIPLEKYNHFFGL